MKQHLQHPVFKIISDIADHRNLEVYVIGGFVRDIFLNRPCKDIDVMVVGSGIDLAQEVADRLGGNGRVACFKNFGTAMIRYHDWEIEFVGARKESYRADSRKPLVEDGTLADDQNRRDFTINAMAICLNKKRFGELVDPFNGLGDLKTRCLRTPVDPDITFSDDPLRMMRAVRFASQLNFTIHPEAFAAIGRNAARLKIVSSERISDEFSKIMLSPRPSVGIGLAFESSLLGQFFPELIALKGVEVVNNKGHKDNFDHTLQVLDKVAMRSDNLWLRWAALLHDIGKPLSKKFIPGTGWTFHGHEVTGARMVYEIFKRQHLPLGDRMKYVKKLVLLHLRPIALAEDHVTDSAVRRLLFEAGDDTDDLMMLCEADITSKNIRKVERFMQNFEKVRIKLREIEEKDRIRNWQPPVSGEMIMKTFGMSPCREVGVIKTAIREAILEGLIGNNFDEACAFMLEEGRKLGLSPVQPGMAE